MDSLLKRNIKNIQSFALVSFSLLRTSEAPAPIIYYLFSDSLTSLRKLFVYDFKQCERLVKILLL